MLDPSEVENIRTKGLVAIAFRSFESRDSIVYRVFYEGFKTLYERHLNGDDLEASPFMSTSGGPDFANYAALSAEKKYPNKKLYHVYFSVWTVDLIETSSQKEVLYFDTLGAKYIDRVVEFQRMSSPYRGRDD